MKVLVDAYWWSDGPPSLRHAVRGIVGAWRQTFPQDELILLMRARQVATASDLPSGVSIVRTRVWPQAISAALVAPLVAKRWGADAILVHNFAPVFGKRRHVYIHDVMFMSNPEWFTLAERIYFRPMVWLAARARTAFTSTETEARRIRHYARSARVTAVGHGLSPEIMKSDVTLEPVPGLNPCTFLLAVGRLNIRKNLLGAIEGAHMSGVLTADTPLVIVGSRDGRWESLPAWVDAAIEDGRVVFTGYVSDGQLRWLMRNCRANVYLSRDEGFGLPPIEAVALGARTLVSNLPIFHETLGNDAEYTNAFDLVETAENIRKICESKPSDGGASSRMKERHNWRNVVLRIRQNMDEVGDQRQ